MASVDIAIPSYQYGRYIGDCLRSILSQGIDDLRILVIDNASTDDSVEVARQFAASDPRIEVRARPVNLGPHASFNEGVDWAKADYFMILCADDFLAPGALRFGIQRLEDNPSATFVHGPDLEYRNGQPKPGQIAGGNAAQWKVISGESFIEDRCNNSVMAVAVLTRTAAQKKAGHYRPELPYTDDLEMLLRLSALGDVVVTQSAQAVRRIHEENISRVLWGDLLRDLEARRAAFDSFFSKDGTSLPGARRLSKLARRRLGEKAYWSGASQLLRGHTTASRELFAFAFACNPSSRMLPPLAQLFRMKNPLKRVTDALSERLRIKHREPYINESPRKEYGK
jgi:glycosyltransferase involved in cell wall biosynthesis